MEKKNSSRLSAMEKSQAAMERSQARMDRRLEEVMKGNLDLQNLLRTVLTNLPSSAGLQDNPEIHIGKTPRSRSHTSEEDVEGNSNPDVGGPGFDEEWWDGLDKASDDDKDDEDLHVLNPACNTTTGCEVFNCQSVA